HMEHRHALGALDAVSLAWPDGPELTGFAPRRLSVDGGLDDARFQLGHRKTWGRDRWGALARADDDVLHLDDQTAQRIGSEQLRGLNTFGDLIELHVCCRRDGWRLRHHQPQAGERDENLSHVTSRFVVRQTYRICNDHAPASPPAPA